jgi:D-3-phosphoglycerate dehydrogenase
VNIADLLNKSRGEYAYTLIDADGSIDAATFAAVRGIEGVLSARLIAG